MNASVLYQRELMHFNSITQDIVHPPTMSRGRAASGGHGHAPPPPVFVVAFPGGHKGERDVQKYHVSRECDNKVRVKLSSIFEYPEFRYRND